MARKITMNGHSGKSVAEVFGEFVISQTAQGLSDVTITNYKHHFHSISNHLDIQQPMESLTKSTLEAMVVSMRASGLAHNSISSYCRVLRTFLNWCGGEGISVPPMPKIKDRETVKEVYTDEELTAILKRPDKQCSFCEFRNWVIVNFLMNCGCRASTIRNIQNQDVDLGTGKVSFIDAKDTEVRKKCNACGHLYCYNFNDLEANRKNANQAVLDSVSALGHAVGGSATASAVNNANARNALGGIVDYNKCPHCGSVDVRELSKEEWTAEQANAQTPTASASSAADELKKFKELLDMGVISQEEFDTKKKQLLGL